MVEITYTSASNTEPRTKLVEPHGIIVGTRHYLVARDGPDDRQFKQYRLDRIIKMSGTSILFQRDPDFDIETYSTFAFGSYFSEAEHGLVRWRFSPRAAPVAREFMFHPTQVLTDMADGGLLVEFTASGWVEMAWHLPLFSLCFHHPLHQFAYLPIGKAPSQDIVPLVAKSFVQNHARQARHPQRSRCICNVGTTEGQRQRWMITCVFVMFYNIEKGWQTARLPPRRVSLGQGGFGKQAHCFTHLCLR